MLGNGRLEAQCFDGERRLAHIRGKLRKKVWINQGAFQRLHITFHWVERSLLNACVCLCS